MTVERFENFSLNVSISLFRIRDNMVNLILNHLCSFIYILLTKREGRTGRISARGLDSTDRALRGPYKKTKGRADILPVRSRASLVNKRFIARLKLFRRKTQMTVCKDTINFKRAIFI